MRKAFVHAVVCLCLVYAAHAHAQPEPREALKQTIHGLQTGNLYTPAYNPQLLDAIRAQTGSRMVYPQLTSLGPVRNITIEEESAIPNGARYHMRAQHQRGVSNWIFEIVRSPPFAFTDFRIESASFGIEAELSDTPGLGNPGRQGDNCLKSPFMCPR